MAQQVVVYTTATCTWCTRVKALLHQKNVPFQEVRVGPGVPLPKPNDGTVPLVTVDGHVLGGFQQTQAWLNGAQPKAQEPESDVYDGSVWSEPHCDDELGVCYQ
jgi:glutaredoxin